MPFSINETATFEYLKQFADMALPSPAAYQGEPAYADLIAHIQLINDAKLASPNADCPALYKKLHELAEAVPVKSPDQVSEGLREFHKTFFKKLYENKNEIPEKISASLIHPTLNKVTIGHKKDVVKKHMKDAGVKGPGMFEFGHPENWANKLFSGVLGFRYNPLKKSNVPFVLAEHQDFKILRFGAQVQGMHNTQPAFENYLAVKKAENSNLDYHHIYFNLQKRNDNNFEARQEHKRTKALEKLNDRTELGVALITLPADNRLFFEGYDPHTGQAKHDKRMLTGDLLSTLIVSIRDNTNDFYIPDEIKKKLFGDNNENLSAKVREMYQKSKESVGATGIDITPEMRQAIFFDFVKFQLTDYIIKEMKPKTINISCKDAIDRGMAHALWFEFNKRIEDGEPMNRVEFEEFMDVSALLVKERPMNDHRNLVWNVLREQYFANPSKFESNPRLQWVPGWLQQNYPQDKKTTPKAQLARMQEFVMAVHDIQKVHKKESERAVLPAMPDRPSHGALIDLTPAPSLVRSAQQVQPTHLALKTEGFNLTQFNTVQSTFVEYIKAMGATIESTTNQTSSFNRSYHIEQEKNKFDYQIFEESGSLTMTFTNAPWLKPAGAAQAIQILAEQAKAYFKATGQQPTIIAKSNSDRDIEIALKLHDALVNRGMSPQFNEKFPEDKIPKLSHPLIHHPTSSVKH